MKVTREFSRLSNAVTDFGYSVKDSFTGLFKDPVTHAENLRELTYARNEARLAAQESLAEVARIRQESMIVVEESRGVGAAIKGGAGKLLGVGVWIAEQPIALAMKPVRWVVNGGTKLFTHFPKAAPVGVVLAGAAAGGSWLANRKSQNLQAQSDMLAQMQMAQAQPMQSYMNSASQADVDARIASDRANGVAGAAGSRADAVMAARQQTPAPETANIAAL